MGKEGLEPSRLAARDPKSRLSASSSTSPKRPNYMLMKFYRQLDICNYNGAFNNKSLENYESSNKF